MCELGFDLVRKVSPDAEDKMALSSSTTLTDREKFERLGLIAAFDPSKPDIFSGMLSDTSIDIQTGTLLGRYIAEERDSGRLFRQCYDQLCSEEEAASTDHTSKTNGHGAKRGKKSERLGPRSSRRWLGSKRSSTGCSRPPADSTHGAGRPRGVVIRQFKGTR